MFDKIDDLFKKKDHESNKGLFDEEKQDEKIIIGDQKVKVVPSNPIWQWLFKAVSFILFLDLLLIFFSFGLYKVISRTQVVPFLEKLKLFLQPMSSASLVIGAISFLLLVIIWFAGLKPPKFDIWVKDIARKRLSCEYIFFKGNYLFIHYDVSLNRNDIMDFIKEISDKSEHFTYYLDNIDIDTYTISINISKKQEIPRLCEIDEKKDTLWNFIPLGEAVNNERKTVSEIGWYLNDNNVSDTAVKTIPSNSLLVAGGTGSGKSVLENGIIGHITRFPDNIQGLLCDVKRVEFSGLENCRGIHKVALTVEEVEELLKQSREIMMDRFKFMESHEVQNVYDLDTEVDWFEINGKSFQFDEILECKVDGKTQLLTVDKIYELVEQGKEVEIFDRYFLD